MQFNVYAIFIPNTGKNWTTDSPFTGHPLGSGKLGFYIKNTTIATGLFTNYDLLTNLLLDVGKIINSIDFLEKTKTESYDRTNISNGIGGFSKLKDLDIELVNNNIQIYKLIGSKVEIGYFTDTVKIACFTGRIKNIEESYNKITLNLVGLTYFNNKRIIDTTITDVNNNIVTPNVIIGNSNTYLPLLKFETSTGWKLCYKGSQKIRDVYVKDSESDNFYKVKESFTLDSDGFLNFTNMNKIKLNALAGINDDFISVNDFHLLQIRGVSTYDPTLRPVCAMSFSTFEGTATAVSILVEGLYASWITNDPTNPIFAVNPLIEYSHFFSDLVSAHPILYINNTHGTDQSTLTYDSIEIVDRSRIKPNTYMNRIYNKVNLIQNDYKDHLNNGYYNNVFYQQERLTPNKAWLLPKEVKNQIIQIDNEKMLIKNFHYFNITSAPDRCQSRYSVIRGYDGTLPEEHLINSDILIYDLDEILTIECDLPVTSINEIHISGITTGLSNYLKNYTDPNRYFSVYYRVTETTSPPQADFPMDTNSFAQSNFILLDFIFPNINGTLQKYPILYGRLKITVLHYGLAEKTPIYYGSIAVSARPEVDLYDYEKRFYRRCAIGYNSWEDIPSNGKQTLMYRTDSSSISMINSSGMIIATGTNTTSDWQPFSKSLVGSWDFFNTKIFPFPYVEYRKYLENEIGVEDWFKDYQDLQDSQLALSFFDHHWMTHLYQNSYSNDTRVKDVIVTVGDVKLKYDLKTDIKDNDFYVTFIPENINNLVLQFPVGNNGSIYYLNGFIFLKSATYPLAVLQFVNSPTPVMNVVSQTVESNYSVSDWIKMQNQGQLVLINNLSIANLFESFRYVKLNYLLQVETYVTSTNSITYRNIGSTIATDGNFVFKIEGTNLNIYSCNSITEGNPVVVLKKLLKDYAKIPDSMIDTVSFNYVQNRKSGINAVLVSDGDVLVNDVIDSFVKEHGIFIFENSLGKLCLVDLNPVSIAEVTEILTSSDVFLDNNEKVDIKIENIGLDYLITEMDIRYNAIGDKFKDLIKSINLPYQQLLTTAQSYLENDDTKVELELKSVYDLNTALANSRIKMNYHFKPSRIITIPINIEKTYNLGDWLKLEITLILNTTNCIYLVIGCNKQLLEFPYTELVLYEYTAGIYTEQYQENYDSSEGIQEVYLNPDEIKEEYFYEE